MKDRLIVALDLSSYRDACRFVRLLKNKVSIFKVGLELFTAAGFDVIRMIHEEGGRVFLDLKFHDIPNTVARACEAADHLGVFMMNLHACGGAEMLKAARSVVRDSLLMGVTVLTSERNVAGTSSKVVRLAKECRKAGLSGVVCSALEAAAVREACGQKFLIVTPGIRMKGERTKVPFGSERLENVRNRWGERGESGIAPRPKDDQKRVVTPAGAIRAGADYIVVGRPILSASDPLRVVESILR